MHHELTPVSNPRQPQGTSTEDAGRTTSTVSGLPVAYTTIKLPEGHRSMAIQTCGSLLAHESFHVEPKGPKQIVVHDLQKGSRQLVETGLEKRSDFHLTPELLVYELAGVDGKTSIGKLRTINIHDLSTKDINLAPGGLRSGVRRLAAHKSHLAVVRDYEIEPYDLRVEIYDCSSGQSWTFDRKPPVKPPIEGMSWQFDINADEQIVSFLVAHQKYATGSRSTSLEDMVLKALVSLERYSFAGQLLSKQTKQIMLHDNDIRPGGGCFGPWIGFWDGRRKPADTLLRYSLEISFHGSDDGNVKTMIPMDWSSADEVIPAYYRVPRKCQCLTWEDLVFHNDQEGQLYVSKNSSPTALDAKVVSRCDLMPLRIEAKKKEYGEMKPKLLAVNEDFLFATDHGDVHCFAFREPDVNGESVLKWRSAKSLFVDHSGPGVLYRRKGGLNPMAPFTGLDPTIDVLQRSAAQMEEMLKLTEEAGSKFVIPIRKAES